MWTKKCPNTKRDKLMGGSWQALQTLRPKVTTQCYQWSGLSIGGTRYPLPHWVLGVGSLQYLEKIKFLRLTWEEEWFTSLGLQSPISLHPGLQNVQLGTQQSLKQSQCAEFAFHGGSGYCITSGYLQSISPLRVGSTWPWPMWANAGAEESHRPGAWA